MDAKELREMIEDRVLLGAADGAIRKAILSALSLAAAVEGPEEATPETDACQGSDGTIRECDELADKSRSLEQRMYRALRALRECEERAGKMVEALEFYKNKSNWGPVADYAVGYWYMSGQPWRMAHAALAAKGDGNVTR